MAWLEVILHTANCGAEAAAGILGQAGFSELVLEDKQEYEQFLEQNRAYWDYVDETFQEKIQGLCQIKLYIEEEDEESKASLESLAQTHGWPLTISPLPETDWEEGWKEHYPPVEVGKKLIVIPYWKEECAAKGRLPVILDPGLTFGTGAHPSTQMVMEVMEQRLKPGSVCLDLGSGSGILSIAALRLGAKQAIGVDIDPKAEDIARENGAYNGFAAPELVTYTGNVTTDRPLMTRLSRQRYDVVLVNIVADVIIALAPVLPTFMDEDSLLVCSGILHNRLNDVKAALERAGLTAVEFREKEDWRCIAAKKESRT